MSVLNKNYKQVVNLAEHVSELNTSELECGTLKTSSVLANSIRPRLSNGVVKSVNYHVNTTANLLPIDSDQIAVTLSGGDEPSSNAVILSASMKSTGGPLSNGTIKLTVGGVDIISRPTTPVVDTTVVNTGGVLGQKVTNYTVGDDLIRVIHAGSTGDVTVSGTITYFEPN